MQNNRSKTTTIALLDETGTKEIKYDSFNFSAGEVHVTLKDFRIANKYDFSATNTIVIRAYLNSSNAIMELLMLKDAIDREFSNSKSILYLSYVPYSRQDRVANQGESHSLKVFCNLINSMNFTEVITVDNHSEVTTSLLNNVTDVPQHMIINEMLTNGQFPSNFDAIISPDAGANKKSFKLSSTIFKTEMIQADKVRSTETGEITGTVVHCDSLKDQVVLIADDICDGGRTVIEITKILKEKGAREVHVFFTHGIFSKGLDGLLESGVDHIYTTNSFDQDPHPKLTVYDLM